MQCTVQSTKPRCFITAFRAVSYTHLDGSCSVESADFVNEQEYWAGGVKPKVEVWLSADSDCYFSKSGKAAFTFNGDKVKYVSSATKYDKELLKLVVTLEKLDDDEEDLDVGDLYWDTACLLYTSRCV